VFSATEEAEVRAALDTLDKRFYSIEGYIAQMTKVTEREAEEFKRICIEKSPD
jgi:hypothetical protein